MVEKLRRNKSFRKQAMMGFGFFLIDEILKYEKRQVPASVSWEKLEDWRE